MWARLLIVLVVILTSDCTVQVGQPNVTVRCVEIVSSNGAIAVHECIVDAGIDSPIQ